MADIVFHNIPHEERREEDAHDGIYKIEPVGPSLVERTGEQGCYLVDDPMEHQCSNGGKETYQEGECKHKSPFADMFLTPAAELSEKSFLCICFSHAYFLIISTSPPLPSFMMLEGR